jgi:polysaccharide export outer membrane protein
MSMKLLVSMFLALTLAPLARAAQAPAVPSAPDNYVIGPRDSLKVTVQDSDALNLNNTYPVDESGVVTLPFLGRVPAGGRTIAQFQDDLAKLLSQGYILHPQVRVDVDQYKSQVVYVTGSVRQPIAIQMQGALTLMAALVQAGSPTSDAADEVQISHSKGTNASGAPTPDPTDADVRHVKLKDLNFGAGNVALQDGDIVFVPAARHFTVTGQVRNSGSYVWEADMTVDKAIARAGGLLDRGSTRGIQARRLVDGKMKDVPLNMQSAVLPDDVITIKQRIF